MNVLDRLFSSRPLRILVVLVWIVLGGIGGSYAQKFQNIQKNEESSFLPGSSESVHELTLAKKFPSGERFAAITVIRRDGGLEPADLAAIAGVRASLSAKLPVTGARPVIVQLSPDKTTALIIVNLNPRGKETLLKDSVNQTEARMAPLKARGLTVKVSGPAGFSRDAVNVFSGINGTLLLATGLLVFVLLIIIYRSPIFWIIPLLSVLMAEAFSRFCGWAIAEAGVTVNGQSAGILPVLVFGAGTDYALLLVARYREELRRHEDKVDAMRLALRRAGPAIFASGTTVILALLCLSLAEVNGTNGLGPIGAMGVALAMLAMLTLLPCALVIGGRRAFWPFVPRYGSSRLRRDPWRVAPRRRARRQRAATGVDHDDPPARGLLHRSHELLDQADQHPGLPRQGAVGRGSEPDREGVPRGRQRPDRRRRPQPGRRPRGAARAAQRPGRRRGERCRARDAGRATVGDAAV